MKHNKSIDNAVTVFEQCKASRDDIETQISTLRQRNQDIKTEMVAVKQFSESPLPDGSDIQAQLQYKKAQRELPDTIKDMEHLIADNEADEKYLWRELHLKQSALDAAKESVRTHYDGLINVEIKQRLEAVKAQFEMPLMALAELAKIKSVVHGQPLALEWANREMAGMLQHVIKDCDPAFDNDHQRARQVMNTNVRTKYEMECRQAKSPAFTNNLRHLKK
jgi:chromosome segregation ATPase